MRSHVGIISVVTALLVFFAFPSTASLTPVSPLTSTCKVEPIFQRGANNFHDSVNIALKLVGVVFNEEDVYRTTVNAQHPEASYYPARTFHRNGTIDSCHFTDTR